MGLLCDASEPISVPWYTSAKRILGGVTYQLAYPGAPLPKRPSEASRTNRRILVHPSQNNPRRRHVPINVLRYTPAETTLGGITYQSAYPGTPLPKLLSEASRTNPTIFLGSCYLIKTSSRFKVVPPKN